MKIDKFELRYGAMPGRCNAYRKNGVPCHRWPITGYKRCHRHGGGWTRSGRRSKETIAVTGRLNSGKSIHERSIKT